MPKYKTVKKQKMDMTTCGSHTKTELTVKVFFFSFSFVVVCFCLVFSFYVLFRFVCCLFVVVVDFYIYFFFSTVMPSALTQLFISSPSLPCPHPTPPSFRLPFFLSLSAVT